MKLWVTQTISSDHPKGEQTKASHVHTCLHFYSNSHIMFVCLMSVEQNRKERALQEERVFKAVEKMTDGFQLNEQSCKLILGANNVICVLFTVIFL